MRELRQRPDPDNREVSSPSVGSQSGADADEDRIERALIDVGVVSADQTTLGTRDEDRRAV